MLTEQQNSSDDIYEVYRLLRKRTCFDILCYLRGYSVYGGRNWFCNNKTGTSCKLNSLQSAGGSCLI